MWYIFWREALPLGIYGQKKLRYCTGKLRNQVLRIPVWTLEWPQTGMVKHKQWSGSTHIALSLVSGTSHPSSSYQSKSAQQNQRKDSTEGIYIICQRRLLNTPPRPPSQAKGLITLVMSPFASEQSTTVSCVIRYTSAQQIQGWSEMCKSCPWMKQRWDSLTHYGWHIPSSFMIP